MSYSGSPHMFCEDEECNVSNELIENRFLFYMLDAVNTQQNSFQRLFERIALRNPPMLSV